MLPICHLHPRRLTLALVGLVVFGTGSAAIQADDAAGQAPASPAAATAAVPHPTLGPTEATRTATDSAAATDPALPPTPAEDTFIPATREMATASPLPSGGPLPLPAEVKPLTLSDCFRLAAVRSDTLKISAQDILIAKTQWSQAVAGLFPTIALANNEAFQNQVRNGPRESSLSSPLPNYVSLPGDSFPLPLFSGRDYISTTGVTAMQTLFNGGQNYNAIGAAKQAIEAKKESLRFAYQTLYQDVAAAFYQTLSDAGEVVILGDMDRDLEARINEINRRVQLGRSRPSEMLQSQADLAGTRVSLEREKTLLATDREMMAFYIGLPAETIYLVDENPLPSAENIEVYLRTLNVRPDILFQIDAIRVAERNVSSAKGQLAPTLTGQFDWTPLNDPKGTQQWIASFTATLPIFDGGLIIGQISQQKEILRQSRINLESLQRTADQQIRTAFVNFNGSVAQYLQNLQYAEFAASTFNAELDDYRHGATSNLNVLAALHNYHTAREQLHLADIDARLSFIKLHVASGNAPTAAPATATAVDPSHPLLATP